MPALLDWVQVDLHSLLGIDQPFELHSPRALSVNRGRIDLRLPKGVRRPQEEFSTSKARLLGRARLFLWAMLGTSATCRLESRNSKTREQTPEPYCASS